MCNNSAEELGLVLGHEISHIICNHTRSRSGLSATLTGLELVALSMLDPSGIASFLYLVFMGNIRNYLTAYFSREDETEADLMGMVIAAKACYNVHRGVNVFHKFKILSEHSEASGDTMFQSHPDPVAREESMRTLAASFNPLYSHCEKTRQHMDTMVGRYLGPLRRWLMAGNEPEWQQSPMPDGSKSQLTPVHKAEFLQGSSDANSDVGEGSRTGSESSQGASS